MKIITTIYRHAELLPHFLDHYRQLGMDQFFIGVHEGRRSPCWRQIQKSVQGYSCVCVRSYSGEYSSRLETTCKQQLAEKHVGRTEWWAVADLDEFHEYPRSMPELLGEAERHDYDYLWGQMYDRVAEDGSLPPVAPGNLWHQYPCVVRFTERILGGLVQKVILLRGHKQLGLGQHWINDGTAFPEQGRIHHFKWHAHVLERMRERYAILSKQQAHWSVESKRFLDYWQRHGRIHLDNPVLECAWIRRT